MVGIIIFFCIKLYKIDKNQNKKYIIINKNYIEDEKLFDIIDLQMNNIYNKYDKKEMDFLDITNY